MLRMVNFLCYGYFITVKKKAMKKVTFIILIKYKII